MKRILALNLALLACMFASAQYTGISLSAFGGFNATGLTSTNVSNDPSADISYGYQPSFMLRATYHFSDLAGVTVGTGYSRFGHTIKFKDFSGTNDDGYPFTITGDAEIKHTVSFADVLLAFNSNIGDVDALHLYVTPGVTLSWMVASDQPASGYLTETITTPSGPDTYTYSVMNWNPSDMSQFDQFQAFGFISAGVGYPVGPVILNAGLNFRYAFTDLYNSSNRNDYTNADGTSSSYTGTHAWSGGLEVGVTYRLSQ